MKKDILFWLIFWSIILSGCSVERKITKAKSVAYQHKEHFADFCATAFPVIPTYIKGKDSVIEKTVEVKGDSIPCPPNEKGEVVKVKCPDAKIITKDVYRTDTVVKENTAKLSDLQLRYNELDKKYAVISNKAAEAEKIAKKRLRWLIVIISTIGVYAVLRIKRILPF